VKVNWNKYKSTNFYLTIVPIKLKFALEQATKAQRGEKCTSTLSLTSALDGVDGQRHAPVALTPRKTRLVAKLVTINLKTICLYIQIAQICYDFC
jgi:hypothetical protein